MWCVSGLDGTNEFIKRNGEFTVNIGLVEGQSPIAGIVFCPGLDPPVMYKGHVGNTLVLRQVLKLSDTDEALRVRQLEIERRGGRAVLTKEERRATDERVSSLLMGRVTELLGKMAECDFKV